MFLLISTRPEVEAADGEREAVVRLAGLRDDEVHQIRLDAAPLGEIDLDAYDGVLLGGGPFNSSDTDKSALQLRVEDDLNRIVDEVVARDLPFLGLCYGVGALAGRLDGRVDRTYGEPVGAAEVTLTPDGVIDPLFDGVPASFRGFVGHKEACSTLPSGATLLATGDACPVQAFRIGTRVYATQFHPELDARGLAERIRIYQHAGYFDPAETDSLVKFAYEAAVSPEVHRILTNFVALARRA